MTKRDAARAMGLCHGCHALPGRRCRVNAEGDEFESRLCGKCARDQGIQGFRVKWLTEEK